MALHVLVSDPGIQLQVFTNLAGWFTFQAEGDFTVRVHHIAESHRTSPLDMTCLDTGRGAAYINPVRTEGATLDNALASGRPGPLAGQILVNK